LEQTLLHAAVNARRQPEERRGRRLSPTTIVARARELLEVRLAEPVYIAELCAAAAVSERSLRNAFYAVFGVSSSCYLLLRRLQLARSAMRSGPARSVTEVALRYGFWELGRFAGQYRAFFGELPSQTLRSRGGRFVGAPHP
jgi:AraC family ethanolamine operon transcriptional activator